MKVLTASLSLASLLISPPHKHTHSGLPIKLAHQYEWTYAAVASKFGKRTPGRNIVRYGLPSGHAAAPSDVTASLGTLRLMLHPPVSTPAAPATAAAAVAGTSTAGASTVSAGSGTLMSCIISHESGGNPQAVSPNGVYSGIGQWSASAWAQDGGTRYASSPTGASASQQMAVLAGEGTAGMQSQQAKYDAC